MRIVIKNPGLNLADALRRAGYGFERQLPKTEEVSARRSLERADYPRFHIYAKFVEGEKPDPYGRKKDIEINLHLDQKKPSYGKHTAHSGEYDGPIIEEEAKRIQDILKSDNKNQ